MSVLPIPAQEPAPGPVALRPIEPIAPPAPRLFPPLRALLDWREPYLIPLAILALTRAALAMILPHASEDAYITYRYARNWILGYGPVFNPGERVFGFTSPLWMAWNAAGWAITRDPTLWSRLTCIAGDAVTLLVTGTMLARHVSRASAWCFTFVFAGWTAFTSVAISGMENSVMVTLLLLSAGLIETGSRATGPSLGALALIRPEGFLAVLVLAWRARPRDRWVALAIAATGLAALTLYYGSPLPQSVTAKAQIYGTPGPWAGRHWWEWTFPFALGRWPVMPDGRFLFLGTVLAAPAALHGLRVLWGIRGSALAFAVAAALAIWLGYVVTGATYFFWYLVVPLVAWFLLVAMGLPRIVRDATIYVSAALLVLGSWTVVWELFAARARAERSFAAVGDYLVAHSSAWDKVLLEPIGIVGYRARVVILDEVGLVSPRIATRRLEGPGWMSDVIAAEQPRWIVIRRGVLQNMEAFAGTGAPFRSTAERDAILSAYAPATTVAEDAGEAALDVLRRR